MWYGNPANVSLMAPSSRYGSDILQDVFDSGEKGADSE